MFNLGLIAYYLLTGIKHQTPETEEEYLDIRIINIMKALLRTLQEIKKVVRKMTITILEEWQKMTWKFRVENWNFKILIFQFLLRLLKSFFNHGFSKKWWQNILKKNLLVNLRKIAIFDINFSKYVKISKMLFFAFF